MENRLLRAGPTRYHVVATTSWVRGMSDGRTLLRSMEARETTRTSLLWRGFRSLEFKLQLAEFTKSKLKFEL